MATAHVSVEVEQDGPQGPSRRRLAVSLALRPRPAKSSGPRFVPGGPRVTAVVPAPTVRVGDEQFEQAVAHLVRLGHARERARHVIALRMKLPDEDVERLREAAR